MTRILPVAPIVAALALILAGQAHALTLTNRDTSEQQLRITSGDDEPVTQSLVIAPDQTIGEICEEGCMIALENGSKQSFDGDEDVYIQNGQFVIAE